MKHLFLILPSTKIQELTKRDENNTSPGHYQTNGQKPHICAVCYQTFSVDELSINFAVCMECVSQSKKPNFCLDKNGVKFFPRSYLKNEASSATVRDLQIGSKHIVDDKNGLTDSQDFVDAGWVVHERVTVFRVRETDEGPKSEQDRCKFESLCCIGSDYCRKNCNHNKGHNFDQLWVICDLYNKEKDGPS